MQAQEIVSLLQPWRDRQQRPAWRPIVVEGEPVTPSSKFGGLPWLAPGEAWPTCGDCGNPLSFFLQLDLADLPSALEQRFGTGVLQLFYCTECDGGWEPFAASQLVRVVDPDAPGLAADPPGDLEVFPVQSIISWEEFTDLPAPTEHDTLGLLYDYDFEHNTVRVNCPEFGVSTEGSSDDNIAEAIALATPGDKLAGWPAWIQGVEYPSCPECEQQMRLVIQLDSDDHLPYMFGDVGTGHITQCPEHLEVVAFGWACS
jgi:uncharacterized protein YwqG